MNLVPTAAGREAGRPWGLEEICPYIRLALYDEEPVHYWVRERIIYDYELIYIKQGGCVITIGDEVFHAKPGMVFLFRPGVRHSILATEGPKFIQPHVHFDLLQYDDRREVDINFRPEDEMTADELAHVRPDVLREMYPDFPDQIELVDAHRIEFLLYELITYYKAEHDRQDVAQVHMKWMFLRLFSQLCDEIRWSQLRSKRAPSVLANNIRLYLEEHYRKRVSLDELSNIYHLDKSYLGRVFHKTYDISIIQFHQRNRIERGKELLRYSNASVTEIADNLDFEDIHAFSRAFKQITGMSPSEYRQQTMSEEKP